MKRLLLLVCTTMPMLTRIIIGADASGISIDAGLTPAEDRWIFRTQVRYMEREDDPTPMDRKMSTYAFPVVLAYGFRPDLTLMLRQVVKHQEMSMGGEEGTETGLADLFVLGKYKVYRRNTPDYILGIAAVLGLELPSGDDALTSDTWDLRPGLYFSWRSGPWAADLDTAYLWNGFADEGEEGLDPGDELSLDLALAYQFSFGEKAQTSLTPVLELSYRHISPDRLGGDDISDTGESVLYLSPGVKFTRSSLILEGLVQLPVWQDQEGSQLERDTGVLLGVRYMF